MQAGVNLTTRSDNIAIGYPALDSLLAALDRARAAVARGRGDPKPRPALAPPPGLRPSVGHEAELARIYVDAATRAAWLEREPKCDAVGIEMAAESFARKRASQRAR